jgi:hypothetical protein
VVLAVAAGAEALYTGQSHPQAVAVVFGAVRAAAVAAPSSGIPLRCTHLLQFLPIARF